MKAIVHANLVLPERIVPDSTILFENGRILASGPVEAPEGAEIIDAHGLYAGPGLVDEHLHGYHWGSESWAVQDDCRAVAAAHLKHGTTTMTPSASYSLTPDEFKSVIRQCREMVEAGGTTVAGVHFEGPFTNPKFGSLAELAWTYSREVCEELFDLAGPTVLHCTYAPELPNAPELERMLAERGIIADIGHTEAAWPEVVRAVANGARIYTHQFDASSHHLGPQKAAEMTGDVQGSAAVCGLALPELYHELICDSLGAHVTEANVRMALRAAGEDRIVLITDASVGGTEGGDGTMAPPVTGVAADDLNYDYRGQLSGSRLTLDAACRNFMRMTGCDVRLAFKCAATNPAKALGLFGQVGSVEPRKTANILLVDGGFRVHQIFFHGEPVPEVRS